MLKNLTPEIGNGFGKIAYCDYQKNIRDNVRENVDKIYLRIE